MQLIKTAVLITILLLTLHLQAQTVDTVKKSTTISGFSLCQTTTTDLQKLSNDFKEISIEEMDLAKECFGQDSRFVAGKGLYSEKFVGIVFQKERDSEYISKIRLTKDFEGNLPDGKPISLKNLFLKDIFKMYPYLKEKWGSRGCSNYWNFSNDTLSFFIKIDSKLKPQFPINESYYLDKPVEAIDLILSCYGVPKDFQHEAILIPKDPIYFVDSARVTKEDLMKYEPTQIATVTVFKEKSAIERLGEEGKNGLIYIETKQFAKKRYWNFFQSKSKDYLKVVPEPSMDEAIVYILNSKILKENFEGDLALIDNENFIGLKIINKVILKKEFKISDKKWGVILETKPKIKSAE